MSRSTNTSHGEDSNPVVIAHAEPKDAKDILIMKRATWLETYVNGDLGVTTADIYKKFPDSSMPESIANWENGIAAEKINGKRYTFVAKENGKVIGFASPLIEEDGKRRIGAMYVAPDSQGKGIGGQLMEVSLDWLGSEHNIYLDVVDYNHNAIGFYKHFGFAPTGEVMPYEEKDGIKHLPQIEMMRPKHS